MIFYVREPRLLAPEDAVNGGQVLVTFGGTKVTEEIVMIYEL